MQSQKSDTFIFTVVPNADSIMLGALFPSLLFGRKRETIQKNCNLSHLMPRLVFVDETAREKGKTRKAYLELQRAVECKLMYGAMAVKAIAIRENKTRGETSRLCLRGLR